jgi:hypothetical protein
MEKPAAHAVGFFSGAAIAPNWNIEGGAHEAAARR